MPNLRDIKSQIETTESIKLITQALGDVATSKIKQTRGQVVHNISYFRELSDVYRIIKILSLRHFPAIKPTRQTNGKTLHILLTSNSHFYGGLDAELATFFIRNSKGPGDRMVVGSTGQDLLLGLSYKEPYTAVVFQEDSPTLTELNGLSGKVIGYEKILVYHTKFVTLLDLQPTISDISASDVAQVENLPPLYYIVEPELPKMLKFFEGQILFMLFEAVFLEVDIARLAARMIAMNQAEQNADQLLQKQRKILVGSRRLQENMEMIERWRPDG